MKYGFTPASERALAYASQWTNRAAPECELGVESLLLGLLVEPECRAATILARAAIDSAAVRRHWPTLAEDVTQAGTGIKRLSSDAEYALQTACEQLSDFRHLSELATEHVLLGIAMGDHEVGIWLRQRGIDPGALATEIRQLYGCAQQEQGARILPEVQMPVEAPVPEQAGGTPAPRRQTPAEAPAPQYVIETAVPQSPSDRIGALRVLDAAANRAQEALRVVEDYLRLVLDDGYLTTVCKELRHELAAGLAAIPFEHRLAARETRYDVGTALETPSERRRGDAGSVLRANFVRLEQSLRSLEEFGKLFDEHSAATIKQLRYRVYTLQRAAEITVRAGERLASTRLYAIIDGRPSIEGFERLVRSLIGAGVAIVQLRDKELDDRELLGRGRLLRALIGEAGPAPRTLWIMNDRPDLAALARADGVHLGQEDVAVKDARRIIGADGLVGVSTHNIEQARQAVLDGADYIGVGPTFPSGTKRFDRWPGLDLLRAVAAEIRLPAFAIGGIGAQNVSQVLAAGFSRIAVSGAILASDDPAAAARAAAGMMKDGSSPAE